MMQDRPLYELRWRQCKMQTSFFVEQSNLPSRHNRYKKRIEVFFDGYSGFC